MAPFGKTLLLNQDSSPERRKKRRRKHLPKKPEKQVESKIILLEERKAEEKRRKEQQKILEAQSTNYKPPNLFDGMQLNSVPNPKPPPPNPGVENLKSLKSESMSFGFLVPNKEPEEPVVEEKPITGKDIFQGLNTLVPDLKVNPFSLKDVQAKEQEDSGSALKLDIETQAQQNTSVSNPGPFDLMDLLSDEAFKQQAPVIAQNQAQAQMELETRISPKSQVIPPEQHSPAQSQDSGSPSQSPQRNSLQGLKRKGDGVTYKWSMDIIKQKQEEQLEARHEEGRKSIKQTQKPEEHKIIQQRRMTDIKRAQDSYKPSQYKGRQELEALQSREPKTVHSARDPRPRGKVVPPAVPPEPVYNLIPPQKKVPEFDFGKVNSLDEMQKGLKEFKQELIRVTVEQHQITQRLDEWKRKIENKEETLKLAFEKENQLVAQDMFEEGQKVKEMVDALKTELETMNQALKSLEKDYNQKEFAKSEIVDKIIKSLERSRDHFESKLDYSRGRLLNWETNEKKKLSSKQQQEEIKVKELENLEQRLSSSKEQLQNEQTQLQDKIYENTKDIIKRKGEVQEELDSVDAKIEQLKKQIQSLQGIRAGLEQNLQECEESIQKEEGKFEEDLSVINSLKKTINKDEERVNALYQEIASIQEQTEELQSKIEKYQEESESNIAVWQTNLEGVSEYIEKYERENSSRLKIVHAISSVSEKLKYLENQEKECVVALNGSKGQVSDLEIEIEQLQKELESTAHKLQTAEMNKKKMAAARQFSKAAIHVKEIKQFKEQTGEIEKSLEMKEMQLKQQNKLIDELSLKLPSLTQELEELQLELKKNKKVFLEIRLKELEEMKDILSNETQTPDFKKLSVIREEKQSTEQELIRIKAVLKLRQEEEEEVKEEEVKEIEPTIEEPQQEEEVWKEEEREDSIKQEEEIQENKIVDVEGRIKELKRKIEESEEKINQASEEEDFEEAARLDEEKQAMMEELEKLGGSMEDAQGELGEIGEKEDQKKEVETKQEEKEEVEEEISLNKSEVVEKEKIQELNEEETTQKESQEVKLNDNNENEQNEEKDNQETKNEEEGILLKIEEKAEVQNDEKHSHENESRGHQTEDEEDEQLEVKLEETKAEQIIMNDVEQETHKESTNLEAKVEEAEEVKEAQVEKKEIPEQREEEETQPLKEEKIEEPVKSEKVEEPVKSEKVEETSVEVEVKEEQGGFSLGGGGGLFSGMSFK